MALTSDRAAVSSPEDIGEMLGPDIPDWVLAEYYANGSLPYLTRLAHIFTDVSSRQAARHALSRPQFDPPSRRKA
jgi:hypothetical protein